MGKPAGPHGCGMYGYGYWISQPAPTLSQVTSYPQVRPSIPTSHFPPCTVSSLASQACPSMHPLPLHMPSSQCCLKPTVLSLPSSTHPLDKSPLSPLPPPSLILSHHAPS